MVRTWRVASAMLLGSLAATGCRQGAGAAVPAYDMIKWGSPKPISERVMGEKYVLPDGWKAAVAGVTRLRVSNFGALRNDPATVANSQRFQQLTGIPVELLPWAEEPAAARTLSILSARSDAVDVLCYNHTMAHTLLVGRVSLHPVDALWNDPNLWKHYAATLQKGLTAPDGRIYGSIGQTRTEILFYRPSFVAEAPGTWQEVREAAKNAARRGVWGFVFPAGGDMDILYPFRAMVYSQGGRLVDAKRQRLVVSSPEGRNAWKMLADMVLVDRSAPVSVIEYSWMQASDAFALGKAAMVLTHTVDADRFRNPQTAPGIRNDWAAAAPPRWDATQPEANRASYLDLDGYAINRFVADRQKAAAMLFVDFMRSYEAAARELLDEGNEAAVLTVYDSPAAKSLSATGGRRIAMANAVLESFPPGGQALTDLMKEYFARVVAGGMDAATALDQLQTRLDEYAVPEK